MNRCQVVRNFQIMRKKEEMSTRSINQIIQEIEDDKDIWSNKSIEERKDLPVSLFDTNIINISILGVQHDANIANSQSKFNSNVQH